MRHLTALFTILIFNIGMIPAPASGADTNQRYYRVICLVHLTGSGAAGDSILPEYIAAGVAAAQAGAVAAINRPVAAVSVSEAGVGQSAGISSGPSPAQGTPPTRPAATPAFTVARPGIIAWRMQLTDDRTMAIVHMVAVDHHAFDAVLADTRPEIRVFELGKTPAATIEKELQSYKQGFSLANFQVVAQ